MLNKSCDLSMLATYYKILLFYFSPAEGSRPQRINVHLLYGTLCVCVCVCVNRSYVWAVWKCIYVCVIMHVGIFAFACLWGLFLVTAHPYSCNCCDTLSSSLDGSFPAALKQAEEGSCLCLLLFLNPLLGFLFPSSYPWSSVAWKCETCPHQRGCRPALIRK